MMIKMSVLMPVYNARKYIKAAVDSILNQTFTDFEFIIINDGSTDGTSGILEAYAEQDSRIRLISRENKGLVASLNEGLELIKTPLIARMDADDIALPTRLEEQFNFLTLNPDTVCVGSFFEVINEQGDGLTVLESPVTNDDIQDDLIKGHTVLCHPTVMMRTAAVLEVGSYKDEYYLVEDLDLWLRLGEVGLLANIPKTLMKYRVLESSVSSIAGAKQVATAKSVIKDASRRRGVNMVFEATEHWRPNETVESRLSFIMKYGWWAFNYKNKKAAVFYGKKAVRLSPFSQEGWRLLFCALFKVT